MQIPKALTRLRVGTCSYDPSLPAKISIAGPYLFRFALRAVRVTQMRPKQMCHSRLLMSPAFSKKVWGHSIRLSILLLSIFRPPNVIGVMCEQLLIKFYADSFETLQVRWL